MIKLGIRNNDIGVIDREDKLKGMDDGVSFSSKIQADRLKLEEKDRFNEEMKNANLEE